MNSQLLEIGERIKELRGIKGLTESDMAERLGVAVNEYVEYETGKKDFSFSVMYNIAAILEVDVVNLISGHSPRLLGCSVVRKGRGFNVTKEGEYEYKHLAYTFRKKKAEPFLVTIQPEDGSDEFHAHEGQEFNYFVSGTMKFYFSDLVYELAEGDSVYFDSGTPHLEKSANDQPVVFVAVVIK